jgi:DNA modification methylase
MMKPYYQDEYATIYHGDCREVLPHLDKVDLVLTDPPYGIGHTTDRYKDSRNGGRYFASKKWRNPHGNHYESFSWDQSPIDDATIQAIRDKAKTQIIWGGNYYALPRCSQWLIWDKQTTGHFTPIEMAWTNLNGAPRVKRHLWHGFARVHNEPRSHPTQKPLDLMIWCIGFARKSQIILDPFMGSGTTLRAAKDMGLTAVGIEIEERYCEIAAERLRQRVLWEVESQGILDAEQVR